MIPVRLKLQGFLSYRDAVEVDFNGLDVACISGSNGAGKSSLLDAMTWALFGQARRRDESVINRSEDAAEVVFDFEYEGDLYQVERAHKRGKTKTLEFRIQGGNGKWRQLTEHSMRETDAAIERTLKMDYDTFTNASFFLQGRADEFAQQRPGKRKEILSSVLGLEVWDTYRESTALRRREQEKELAAVDTLLAELHAEIQKEDERRAVLKGLEDDLAQKIATRKIQESALESQRMLKTALAEQEKNRERVAKQRDAARGRLEQQNVTLTAREKEAAQYQEQLARADEISTAYQQWQAARESLAAWEKTAANFHQHDAKRAEPRMEIDRQRSALTHEQGSLQAKMKEIEALVETLPALEADLAQARKEVEAANARLAEQAALDEEEQRILDEQTEAKAENKRLKEQMKELRARIDQLKESGSADCPLCGQSLDDPEAFVGHMEQEGRQQGDRYRANQARMQEIDQRLVEMRKEKRELRGVETKLREQQRQLDQLESRKKTIETQQADWLETGKPRLDEITTILEKDDFAHEARAALAEIDASLKELGYDSAAHDAARSAEEENRNSEAAFHDLKSARAALGPLEREIEGLKEQVAVSEKEAAEAEEAYFKADAAVKKAAESLPDIDAAERELLDLREQENILRRQIGGIEQEIHTIENQKERQTREKERREVIARQVGYLKTLERAFGKDGVPALLIEQALPEIEGQANDLLDRLSDGQMSVRFVTQKDYKDTKRTDKKETLDILISDAAGQREYELFSGGEAFRINFAIRLALSRVLSQRAGGRLQMLVIDEGFGSQDAEGRQRLIEVINLVRTDFARILVITHLEQLKDAFPARIEVEKTLRGSQVKVVT